jgi:ABC-2 type transport system permease protein
MRAIKAILTRNITKFTRDKLRLFFTLLMAGFFLFIFSFVMKSVPHMIDQPMNYLISGIIIMTVFQTALNNSLNVLEDISSGFMKEILVAPIPRWQIAIGQIISAAVVAVFQGFMIIVMGLFLGLKLTIVHLMVMTGVMLLVGLIFSAMGIYLATLVKNSTTFQIMISVLVMPLVFLSGAYIPTTVIPNLLRPVVYLNPLTYTTAVFRYFTLTMNGLSLETLVKTGVAFDFHGFIICPYLGLCIMIVMGLVFLALAIRRFDRADFSSVRVFKGKHRF